MSEDLLNVDAEIDRALASLRLVEPSPALAAGVRARTAEMPAPHRWGAWALAAAAGLLVVVSAPAFGPPERPVQVASTFHDVVLPLAAIPAEPAAARPDRHRGRITHAAAPEVVIDPALERDMRRLFRLAAEAHGRLAAVSTIEAAEPLKDLAVALVAVEELTVPAIGGGERR